jgi:hypothetical protein
MAPLVIQRRDATVDITFANNNIMLVNGSFLQASDITADELRAILEQAETPIVDAIAKMYFTPRHRPSSVSLGSILIVRLTPSLKTGLRADPGPGVFRIMSALHPRFYDYWLAATLPMFKPEARSMTGLPGLGGLCLAVSPV